MEGSTNIEDAADTEQNKIVKPAAESVLNKDMEPPFFILVSNA